MKRKQFLEFKTGKSLGNFFPLEELTVRSERIKCDSVTV